MKILGLSFDYHDSAAALIDDGKVIAAAQEERFSRKKNDSGFPTQAIRFCLEEAGITSTQLDRVIYYEDPLHKFDRILRLAKEDNDYGSKYLDETLRLWVQQGKFEPEERIADTLGIPKDRVACIKHHQSHAASAFYCSPFEQATVVTLDGVGENETLTISHGEGGALKQLVSQTIPDSLGLLYSAFTSYLGFEVNEGEYKVMGMAGFGTPDYIDQIRNLVTLLPAGRFSLTPGFLDTANLNDKPYTEKLVEILGPARAPETPFDPTQSEQRRFANIAASIQLLTEEIILHVANDAIAMTGVPYLCMAGGVALNSVANGMLQRRLKIPVYVHPAAGDAGGALGAALFAHHIEERLPRTGALTTPYLGRRYSMDECQAALDRAGVENLTRFDEETALVKHVAGLLAEGKVIGWLQGRFEWGPRALGARSILADPRRADMQLLVNEKIKFREPFRPFAPSVLVHRAHEFFDIPQAPVLAGLEDYMLSVCPVRESKKAMVPAITHVDGTSRIHAVRASTNPRYFALITEFEKMTGIPLVMNTSFNRRGEPIVASPDDALETFYWTGLDVLVLENFVITK